MKKAETVPDNHIIPNRRRAEKRERRFIADRRQEVRWEPDKALRREQRIDRRKSSRCPWEDSSEQ